MREEASTTTDELIALKLIFVLYKQGLIDESIYKGVKRRYSDALNSTA